MIYVFFLPVETVNGAEQVVGIDLIHDAILDCTEDPLTRRLIMDTTADEFTALSALCTSSRPPTQEEIDLYNSQVIITPPDPDYERACELLASSPAVITQPEMWELLRLFGKRLGYHFE